MSDAADVLWKKYCGAQSIVFRAACNEAVEPAMRPVSARVLARLEVLVGYQSELERLFEQSWAHAVQDFPQPGQLMDVEKKFIDYLANDGRWKTLVLDAVISDRSWRGALSAGNLMKILGELLQKFLSPHHPVAQRGSSVVVSVLLGLFTLWLPTRLHSRFYLDILFGGDKQAKIPIELEVSANSPKLQVDTNCQGCAQNTVVSPSLNPSTLKLTLEPKINAALNITPSVQYPKAASEALAPAHLQPTPSIQPGVPVHFVPDGDIFLVPKHLLDGSATINVSVKQLQAEGSAADNATVDGPLPSTESVAASRERSPVQDPSKRPLDRIGDSLTHLESEFQATTQNVNLAELQKNQNQIHSAGKNQEQVRVIEVRPNTVHSVVLQWIEPNTEPESCTVTFKVDDVSGSNVKLSGVKEICTASSAEDKKLPSELSLRRGETICLRHWILSVDETHLRWLFLHAATLRFTWQPDAHAIADTQGAESPGSPALP